MSTTEERFDAALSEAWRINDEAVAAQVKSGGPRTPVSADVFSTVLGNCFLAFAMTDLAVQLAALRETGCEIRVTIDEVIPVAIVPTKPVAEQTPISGRQ